MIKGEKADKWKKGSVLWVKRGRRRLLRDAGNNTEGRQKLGWGERGGDVMIEPIGTDIVRQSISA